MQFIQSIKDLLIGQPTHHMSEEERTVFLLLRSGWYQKIKITQREIAVSEDFLGCTHYEDDLPTKNAQTTLRKVRQIIRKLRIHYKLPILSDIKGYYFPQSEEEAIEYLEREGKAVASQMKAWHETYEAMTEALGFGEEQKELF